MFIFVSLFLPVALAQTCCPPSKWEGIEYVAIGSTDKDGNGHYMEIEQNATYDMDLRRVYLSQSLNYDGQPIYQTVLQDYSSGEQYVTQTRDGVRGQCTIVPIDSMEPGCIPANATVVTKSYIGAGNSKLAATMYSFPSEDNMSQIYFTVADDGCIPLSWEANGRDKNGGGYSMTVEFYGITAGVSDYGVFRTPRNCHHPNPVFVGVGK